MPEWLVMTMPVVAEVAVVVAVLADQLAAIVLPEAAAVGAAS